MTTTCKTVAALALALCMSPLAGTPAFAADDKPIVNDYSHMGADYNAPEKSKEASGDAAGAGQSKESSQSSASADSGEDGKPYKVDCSGDSCRASQDVVQGYDKFGQHCARCHGENAEGTTFAPSLVQRLKSMGQGRFTAAVAGGVTKMDTTTGGYRVMPAWAQNDDVMSNIQQIWAFLKARSDGALKPGRPQAMDKQG